MSVLLSPGAYAALAKIGEGVVHARSREEEREVAAARAHRVELRRRRSAVPGLDALLDAAEAAGWPRRYNSDSIGTELHRDALALGQSPIGRDILRSWERYHQRHVSYGVQVDLARRLRAMGLDLRSTDLGHIRGAVWGAIVLVVPPINDDGTGNGWSWDQS